MADPDSEPAPVETAVYLVGRAKQLRGQTVHAGVESGVIDEWKEFES